MDMEMEPANRQREILRKVRFLALIAMGLFAVVFLAPNASPYQGAFFKGAMQTSWSQLLDLPAMWSSVKIILFSIGLFLLIESLGTILAVFKLKSLALPVFFMQILPCAGLLCGSYYLLKSLL